MGIQHNKIHPPPQGRAGSQKLAGQEAATPAAAAASKIHAMIPRDALLPWKRGRTLCPHTTMIGVYGTPRDKPV